MRKPTFLKVLPVPILLLAILACGVIGTPAPKSDTLSTVVAATLTSMPVLPTQTEAAPPPPTFTPMPPASSSPEPMGVRYVYTQAQNVNLRVNPGRLFKVSRVLAQGTKLQVLGVAPGGEWLNVVNDEGVIGWVGVDFVSGGFDGPPPPTVNPKDVLVVTGTLLDPNGNPINGIGFEVEQGSQLDNATTDETGTFYAFLPTKFPGTWTVSFVSVACVSNTMDSNCDCLDGVCGKPYPESVTVTVPMSAPLSFVWK